MVALTPWESRCARPLSTQVDAPTEQAMPKVTRGRGTSASRRAASGKDKRIRDRPWSRRTLDHRFGRGAMGGLGSCPAIPHAWWPLAHLVRDPLALPGPLWLVALACGCADSMTSHWTWGSANLRPLPSIGSLSESSWGSSLHCLSNRPCIALTSPCFSSSHRHCGTDSSMPTLRD